MEYKFNVFDILITIKAKELTKYFGICYSDFKYYEWGMNIV